MKFFDKRKDFRAIGVETYVEPENSAAIAKNYFLNVTSW